MKFSLNCSYDGVNGDIFVEFRRICQAESNGAPPLFLFWASNQWNGKHGERERGSTSHAFYGATGMRSIKWTSQAVYGHQNKSADRLHSNSVRGHKQKNRHNPLARDNPLGRKWCQRGVCETAGRPQPTKIFQRTNLHSGHHSAST